MENKRQATQWFLSLKWWKLKALPSGCSAQRAELIALIRALELGKGEVVNIYTDSKYAYSILHAHGAIWKERGMLTSGNKQIKNGGGVNYEAAGGYTPAKEYSLYSL